MPLPTVVQVNGVEVNWDAMATAPLPFAPGWDFRIATHGPASMWEFRVGSRVVHRAVLNGSRDMTAPPLKLRYDGEIDLLGPLEGHLWTDDPPFGSALGFLAPAAENPYDDHFVADAYKADTLITNHTGSSGVERFLSEGLVCLKHGASPAAYRWFASYAAFQFRRPRWITRNGLPDGLDGRDVAPIPGFSEWYSLSDDGLNPGDAQHADVDELYWGWRLFKDPMFLVALIQAWMTFRWQFLTWRNPTHSKELYAGSVRTPGLLLKATALLIDALHGVDSLVMLRNQAVAFALAHVQNLESGWPIYTISGSVPPEMRDANDHVKAHTKPWQDSILALGLQYLDKALARRQPSYPHVAALSERILDWLDAECWDYEQNLFCDVLAKDGTKHWIPLALGTALWPSSSLHWSPVSRDIRKGMVAFLYEIEADEPTNKHHLGWYIGSVPMLAGYSTGLEVEGVGVPK